MKAKHPHISGLTIEIDENDAARYEAAGWVLPKPRKKAAEKAADINDSTGDGEHN